MKTILTRLKTLVDNNRVSGQTLSYVKDVEVVHPDLGQLVLSVATLPKILFVPESTSESWVASQEKESVNVVNAYLVMAYSQRESSILGDSSRPSGHGKGILDFVADFLSVARGHLLGTNGTRYLDKPLDIESVDYFVQEFMEGSFYIIAQARMVCSRIFLQTTVSVNV